MSDLRINHVYACEVQHIGPGISPAKGPLKFVGTEFYLGSNTFHLLHQFPTVIRPGIILRNDNYHLEYFPVLMTPTAICTHITEAITVGTIESIFLDSMITELRISEYPDMTEEETKECREKWADRVRRDPDIRLISNAVARTVGFAVKMTVESRDEALVALKDIAQIVRQHIGSAILDPILNKFNL